MTSEELKLWLKQHEVSRAELGSYLGLSRSLISAWTLGERDVPEWLDFVFEKKNLMKIIKRRKKK
jgi:transcriptional regulator with XRE-family HTH domain